MRIYTHYKIILGRTYKTVLDQVLYSLSYPVSLLPVHVLLFELITASIFPSKSLFLTSLRRAKQKSGVIEGGLGLGVPPMKVYA